MVANQSLDLIRTLLIRPFRLYLHQWKNHAAAPKPMNLGYWDTHVLQNHECWRKGEDKRFTAIPIPCLRCIWILVFSSFSLSRKSHEKYVIIQLLIPRYVAINSTQPQLVVCPPSFFTSPKKSTVQNWNKPYLVHEHISLYAYIGQHRATRRISSFLKNHTQDIMSLVIHQNLHHFTMICFTYVPPTKILSTYSPYIYIHIIY